VEKGVDGFLSLFWKCKEKGQNRKKEKHLDNGGFFDLTAAVSGYLVRMWSAINKSTPSSIQRKRNGQTIRAVL